MKPTKEEHVYKANSAHISSLSRNPENKVRKKRKDRIWIEKKGQWLMLSRNVSMCVCVFA